MQPFCVARLLVNRNAQMTSNKNILEEIIQGCKAGKSRSQEMLYSMFAGKMLGICARYATDRFEAEDMMQVAFVRMFEKIQDFRGEGSFEGWLKRIMVTTSIGFYRKKLRMLPVVASDEFEDNVKGWDMADSRLNAQELLNLIQKLSPGYRIVFNMYAIEGYSHKEIAKELAISEGTSKSQLARARGILKEQVLQMEGISNERSTK